jgi:AraC-like DNA-binding protein
MNPHHSLTHSDSGVLDIWSAGLDHRQINTTYRGRCSWVEIQPGLILHTTDATSLKAYDVSGAYSPGLAFHCFIEGSADAALGGKPMNLGREGNRPVQMRMSSITRPELFQRRSKPGHYVRKLHLFMTHDWLERNGLALSDQTMMPHLKTHQWDVSPDELLNIERMVTHAGRGSALTKLEVQSAALGVICSSFARLDAGQTASHALTRAESRKLDRMEQYIHDETGGFPTLAQIAEIGGVSLSSMRRLFRAEHDCTVQEYVRKTRLDRARRALERDGVSVAEAAQIAGYRSPENFSAAFRKMNQISPSDVQSKFSVSAPARQIEH